jgi:hypothetical protein
LILESEQLKGSFLGINYNKGRKVVRINEIKGVLLGPYSCTFKNLLEEEIC